MNIWVPRLKILEPKRELLVPRKGLAGFFKLEAVRPDGRRRLLADWFPNIITNAGLNSIGTVSTYLNCCKVGSGSATPTALDTAMQSFVASTNTQFSVNRATQGSAPYYGSTTIVYRFAAGVAAGNLQEIGIGVANNNTGVLWSRALILDGGGSPTTITVLADEVLDATYQCRIYPPLVDIVDTINIAGDIYAYTLRAMSVTSQSFWALPATGGGGFNTTRAYDGAIGAITSGPAGSSTLVQSLASAYSDNSLFLDVTATWGLEDSNFAGGIDSVSNAFGQPGSNAVPGSIQIGFTPAIPKDNTKTLSLVFRNTWARATI